MKKNNYVKFHAKQGLMLFIVSFVGSLILAIIPIIGWILLPIYQIIIIILVIIGIIRSVNGEQKELPIIGEYANKVFKF